MTRRVLVVDDDPLLREVAKAALEMVGGWQVLTAGSGPEAQAVVGEHRPDALLLDVMMPGQDGPTTVVAMQRDPRTRDIPVVFLTAKAGAAAAGDSTGTPVVGVIAKPFDPMTLSVEVARLLGW